MLPHPIRTLFVSILLICTYAPTQNHDSVPSKFNEATIAQLQADMAGGKLTSVELTQFYLTRSRIKVMPQELESLSSNSRQQLRNSGRNDLVAASQPRS